MMPKMMIGILAALFIASSSASITRLRRDSNEECMCNKMYVPVCGADGNTYGNICELQCAAIEKVSDGECPECICTMEYWPVCGTDGKTYSNLCELECADVELDFEGPCENTRRKRAVDADACVCTTLHSPVCGEDGKTYGNTCMMECAGVQQIHEGACKEKPPCVCTKEQWPVCGKNGKTYSNMCELECAGVEIDFEGPCEDSRRKRSFFEYDDCACPKIYLPVCGTDDVTYPSNCVRQCGGVGLKSIGECKDMEEDDTSSSASQRRRRDDEGKPTENTTNTSETEPETTEPTEEKLCPCPRIYIPMCGKDGKTYPNRCEMACKDVEFAYFGQC